MGYGYGGYGMMNGGWFGWWPFMLVFWVVVIVGGFFIFRWLMRQSRPSTGPAENTALEILKQPYARGEISHEEFDQMKARLS
jgi:putative membrane protein